MNYIKDFLNIVDNKTEENYLSKVFVKSSVGGLNLFNENSIYKRKLILNTDFDYIEVTFLNEKNEEISFKDFSVFHYLLNKYIMPLNKLSEMEQKLNKDYLNIKSR